MGDAIRLLNSIGFFILKTQIMKTKKELIEKRDKLQKEIDNFKEETFKNGDWIKLISNNKVTVCITDFKKAKGYGFPIDKKWCDEKQNVAWTFSDNPEDWVKMTDKEAEQALIKEAKKRGFKEGNYKCLRYSKNTVKHNEQYSLTSKGSLATKFINGTRNIIFNRGKWAEIIEDKKPTINGYEMEVDDDYVKFGCAVFHKNRLKELNEVIENWESLKNEGKNNRTIKSITLCSGTEIKAEELKEVVDYLNK